MEHQYFSEDEVHRQSEAILLAWGSTLDHARISADVLTYADLSGIDSHGVSLFINYEKLLGADSFDPAATPEVVRENASTALVDARGGLGHPAGVAAMELAIAKATATGVGVVTVRNSHHFGAAGYYSALAARHGLVGMAMTSGRTSAVVPTGGAQARLPTNPIAFAAPARTNEPFLLDMSTSTVAVNKLKVHDLEGRPLPEGWFVDGDGRTVTDASAAVRAAWDGSGGGLTPLGGTRESGGHKGYGLAVMVQLLSCALSGGAFSPTRGPGEPDNIGHFFLVIDPSVFRPGGEFLDDVDEVVDVLHATPPAPGGEVLVAGEPESRTRAERTRDGIPLPVSLLGRLADICSRTGAPFLLGR
jgi:LDH2 family malate/lactate/ureidoglycolate dehydrogenase